MDTSRRKIKNGAGGLGRPPYSGFAWRDIKILCLNQEAIFLWSSASQGSYGEGRSLVREWSTAMFNRHLLGPNPNRRGDKRELMGLKRKQCLAFLSTFFCGRNR
jgi:hypothetical protein